MRFKAKLVGGLTLLCLALMGGAAWWGYRAYRVFDITRSWQEQLRFLVASGGDVGSVPASQAFDDGFLDSVLGDNVELLEDLRTIIAQGLEETPSLHLGEVTAISVTYNRTPEGENENVSVHIAGGFPMGSRRPGFHRDGYFRGLLDRQLYSMGNQQVSILGRDMIFFTTEENEEQHRELVDSLYEGEILLLAQRLTNRVYHSTVFPNPANALPPQLRRHVKTVVTRGHMGQHDGRWDILLITESPESARYVASVLKDMKRTAEVTLATVMGGEPVATEWGGERYLWWSRAMLEMLRSSELERQVNLVRARTNYERVMVNATLKTVERAMRDYRAIRERFAQTDPRFARALERADAEEREAMIAAREAERIWDYWSDAHEEGPDWPIPPPEHERRSTEEPAGEPADETS